MSNGKITALVPRSVTDLDTISSKLARSRLIPSELHGKEGDVMAIVMAGLELGLAPMASIRGIHIIKGKPVLGGATCAAVALGSGHCEYFTRIHSDNTKAAYKTKRKGAEEVVLEYTIEDAKRAGLTGKDNWKKHPAEMLRARCTAALARDVYPDLLAGVYTQDEAESFDDDPDAVDAEVIDWDATEEFFAGDIARAQADDELSAVALSIKNAQFPEEHGARARLLEQWRERREELRGD